MIVAKAERFVVRVGLAGDEAAARQVVDYPADSGAAEDDPVAEITHRQPAVGHGLELEQDVVERPDAKVAAVFPPRGRTFTVIQTHWFRMNDAKVAEHWANRDDVGMGQQLGWNPPTLLYLARMLLASRRARRR